MRGNCQTGRLDDFGSLLHDAWQAKRAAVGVTDARADRAYEVACAAGALGEGCRRGRRRLHARLCPRWTAAADRLGAGAGRAVADELVWKAVVRGSCQCLGCLTHSSAEMAPSERTGSLIPWHCRSSMRRPPWRRWRSRTVRAPVLVWAARGSHGTPHRARRLVMATWLLMLAALGLYDRERLLAGTEEYARSSGRRGAASGGGLRRLRPCGALAVTRLAHLLLARHDRLRWRRADAGAHGRARSTAARRLRARVIIVGVDARAPPGSRNTSQIRGYSVLGVLRRLPPGGRADRRRRLAGAGRRARHAARKWPRRR